MISRCLGISQLLVFLPLLLVLPTVRFDHRQFKTSGEGDELQRSLLEYSADKDSYFEEFWDDSYLTPKTSVVLNLKCE